MLLVEVQMVGSREVADRRAMKTSVMYGITPVTRSDVTDALHTTRVAVTAIVTMACHLPERLELGVCLNPGRAQCFRWSS